MRIKTLLLSTFTSCLLIISAQSSAFDFINGMGLLKKNISFAPVWNMNEDGNHTRSKFSRSFIKRTENKVCINANVKGLDGEAYSGWVFIFNDPENCDSGIDEIGSMCSQTDLANPNVSATGMWGLGLIAGDKERAYIDKCFEIGETTHFVMGAGDKLGLTDPMNAEVHILLRNHGPAAFEDSELLGKQLNSYRGGCNMPGNEMEGAFDCYEEKVIVH